MAAGQRVWIESFDYFRAGNPFAGSCGGFSFKIFPQKEPARLWVECWAGPNCCEMTPSEERTGQAFAYTEEGLAQAVDWINAGIDAFALQAEEEEMGI